MSSYVVPFESLECLLSGDMQFGICFTLNYLLSPNISPIVIMYIVEYAYFSYRSDMTHMCKSYIK